MPIQLGGNTIDADNPMPSSDATVAPGTDIIAITQHDETDDPAGPFRGFLLSATGAVKIRTAAGNDRTITSGHLLAGVIYPIQIVRVFDTGTDAITVYGIK